MGIRLARDLITSVIKMDRVPRDYFDTLPREVRAHVLGYTERPDLDAYAGLSEDAHGDVEFLTSRIPVTTTHATEELLEDFDYLGIHHDENVRMLFDTLWRLLYHGTLRVTGRRTNNTWLFPYLVQGHNNEKEVRCDVSAPHTFHGYLIIHRFSGTYIIKYTSTLSGVIVTYS